MKEKIILLSFLIIFGALASAQFQGILIVNESAKECAPYWLGNDCTICQVPEGWDTTSECPEGYSLVEIEMDCSTVASRHCLCDIPQGPENCRNFEIIVNSSKKQCSAVEDITACTDIPESWERRPVGVSVTEWVCPENYSLIFACPSDSGFEPPPIVPNGNGGNGSGRDPTEPIFDYWPTLAIFAVFFAALFVVMVFWKKINLGKKGASK
ncbi:MAG: hypothetical protein JW772_03670 [Candidatus Diapherotrites archaeon]|nr:hypothetical protein [Candidatus Diapherotrites archaeon]